MRLSICFLIVKGDALVRKMEHRCNPEHLVAPPDFMPDPTIAAQLSAPTPRSSFEPLYGQPKVCKHAKQ